MGTSHTYNIGGTLNLRPRNLLEVSKGVRASLERDAVKGGLRGNLQLSKLQHQDHCLYTPRKKSSSLHLLNATLRAPFGGNFAPSEGFCTFKAAVCYILHPERCRVVPFRKGTNLHSFKYTHSAPLKVQSSLYRLQNNGHLGCKQE